MTEQIYRHGPPTVIGKIPFTPPGTQRACETAYWLWGDLESKIPPLIVLHGGPGAPGRDWRAITILTKTHGIPIILYDQIGCGDSTHLPDTKGDLTFWTMELFIAELNNLRQHLKIQTFDLLGHSCGGMIAVSYALTQPQGLRKLIVASSAASEPLRAGAQLEQRAALPQDMQDTILAAEQAGDFNTPEYLKVMEAVGKRHLCRMDPWPPELTECIELMMKDDTVVGSLYGPNPVKPTGSWKNYDAASRAHEITASTAPGGVLLTTGKYDMAPAHTMVPFFNKIRARVKWMIFAESSHAPHVEEMEAHNSILADFLTVE